MSLTFLFLILIQIFLFIFSLKISSDFKLDKSLYLINKNQKVFAFSLSFINPYSSKFYSNKIFINNIHVKKENCKCEFSKIKCLIHLNENFLSSNEILIKVDKTIIKAKKLYYDFEIYNNEIFLNLFSKKKYFIKIKNEKFESINDKISKFKINKYNDLIEIYDSSSLTKIGSIKEKHNKNIIKNF